MNGSALRYHSQLVQRQCSIGTVQQTEDLKANKALILTSGCSNGIHPGRGHVKSSPSEVELLLPRKADNGPSPICTAFHVTVAPEIHVIV